MVKNQFLRVLGPEGPTARVLLQEALFCVHGEAVPAIASICLKDWKACDRWATRVAQRSTI
eukprot:2856528-Lingulodinium_polyedra.AAC.1